MKTINIDDSQHDRLKKRKEETGVPMAEIVRRAIDEYLSKPPVVSYFVKVNDENQP